MQPDFHMGGDQRGIFVSAASTREIRKTMKWPQRVPQLQEGMGMSQLFGGLAYSIVISWQRFQGVFGVGGG